MRAKEGARFALLLALVGCVPVVPPNWTPERPPPCETHYGVVAATGLGAVALGVGAWALHCSEETPDGEYDVTCGLRNVAALLAAGAAVGLSVPSLLVLDHSWQCEKAVKAHETWLAHPHAPGAHLGRCRDGARPCHGDRLSCVEGICVLGSTLDSEEPPPE